MKLPLKVKKNAEAASNAIRTGVPLKSKKPQPKDVPKSTLRPLDMELIILYRSKTKYVWAAFLYKYRERRNQVQEMWTMWRSGLLLPRMPEVALENTPKRLCTPKQKHITLITLYIFIFR